MLERREVPKLSNWKCWPIATCQYRILSRIGRTLCRRHNGCINPGRDAVHDLGYTWQVPELNESYAKRFCRGYPYRTVLKTATWSWSSMSRSRHVPVGGFCMIRDSIARSGQQRLSPAAGASWITGLPSDCASATGGSVRGLSWLGCAGLIGADRQRYLPACLAWARSWKPGTTGHRFCAAGNAMLARGADGRWSAHPVICASTRKLFAMHNRTELPVVTKLLWTRSPQFSPGSSVLWPVFIEPRVESGRRNAASRGDGGGGRSGRSLEYFWQPDNWPSPNAYDGLSMPVMSSGDIVAGIPGGNRRGRLVAL